MPITGSSMAGLLISSGHVAAFATRGIQPRVISSKDFGKFSPNSGVRQILRSNQRDDAVPFAAP